MTPKAITTNKIPIPTGESPTLHRAGEIASHYQRGTGVACNIINEDMADFPGCCLCKKYGSPSFQKKCMESHLHSCKQAEKFGGSFIYFCPASLMFWSSPVINEGKKEGALVAGPVLVVQEKDISEEWQSLFPTLSEELMHTELSVIPRMDTTRSRSLAEMLLMSAGWVMDSGDRQLIEGKKSQEQQNRISEYIHELKKRESTGISPSYPFEKEEQLLTAVSEGDKAMGQKMLNEILGTIFFSSGRNFELIKFRIMELIVLLSRAAIQGGAVSEEILSFNYSYFREIEKIRSVDKLAYWLSGILHRFTALVFDLKGVKHVRQMEKALQYINDRYTEKISLEEVADYTALSITYFSRIFKEEMKCSFTGYINKIRVEHAKSLLKKSSLPLIEIAGMVGFDDQSYFSKIFKQVTGTAPGKYRESAGSLSGKNQEIHKDY
ncbi:MAG: helix-turn-helix domain-containing protein [Spirochaetales bacterium]|nr:helix-turn-helix domain-containing protein [Spirochaetales bacterium]